MFFDRAKLIHLEVEGFPSGATVDLTSPPKALLGNETIKVTPSEPIRSIELVAADDTGVPWDASPLGRTPSRQGWHWDQPTGRLVGEPHEPAGPGRDSTASTRPATSRASCPSERPPGWCASTPRPTSGWACASGGCPP